MVHYLDQSTGMQDVSVASDTGLGFLQNCLTKLVLRIKCCISFVGGGGVYLTTKMIGWNLNTGFLKLFHPENESVLEGISQKSKVVRIFLELQI